MKTKESEILSLVTELRAEYFCRKLQPGYCINICILLGRILQVEYGKQVEFVSGQLGDCYHTWLCVDGVEVDPSTDCTFIEDGRPWVTLTNSDEYRTGVLGSSREPFDINDYFLDVSLDKLKWGFKSERRTESNCEVAC